MIEIRLGKMSLTKKNDESSEYYSAQNLLNATHSTEPSYNIRFPRNT